MRTDFLHLLLAAGGEENGGSDSIGSVWGTVPSMGNVAQPPLGKASGE